MKQSTRAYIYRVLNALIPIATTYGLIDGNKAALITSAVLAVFGTGLATLNTTTKPPAA